MIQSPSTQTFFPWVWFYGPLPHSPCWLYSSGKTSPWLIHTSIRASIHGWSCAVPTILCQPASVKQTFVLPSSHTTIWLHFCAPLIPPSPRDDSSSPQVSKPSLSHPLWYVSETVRTIRELLRLASSLLPSSITVDELGKLLSQFLKNSRSLSATLSLFSPSPFPSYQNNSMSRGMLQFLEP